MKKIAYIMLLLALACNPVSKERITLPSSEELHNLAMAESLIPIHPGNPGKSPFWNTYSHRFIYAPAFEFEESESADRYKYSIISGKGEDTLVFIADKPWESLSPIWDQVPTSNVKLVLEAVNDTGVTSLAGERSFYRASPFKGPYHPGKENYRASAERLFRYLYNAPYIQYWLDHKEPDPAYGLYSYPAKMYSAVVSGILTFSELTDDPSEKDRAIKIATIVADKLISISEPEGNPLEYFPPTYTGPIYADMVNEWRGESLADRMMLIYPASAGQVYLDLYEQTGDKKYYNAALNIAETYKKTQLTNGTWYLLVYIESGDPVTGNYVAPTGVNAFLKRMGKMCGCSEYSSISEKALSWLEGNMARDFNWEGQFEDQKPSDRYKNLSKGQACSYAIQLFESAGEDTLMIREAEDLIRFAVDQFVIWENPVQGDYWGINSKDWITP